MYDYNTIRPHLILKEYGRNIQKLMEQFTTIEDKTLRTQKAYALVKLMETVNPHVESTQKRWDDLFIISDYKLNIYISAPPPIPKTDFKLNDTCMPPIEPIKYKYYGRYVESLLHKVSGLSSLEEQASTLLAVAKLMRRFSSIWNNDCISNEKIIEDIRQMLAPHTVDNLEIIRTLPEEGAFKAKSKYQSKTNKKHHNLTPSR